jgi:hypothetical protein
LKIKRLSDEAKQLDEKIQNVIEDKDLTWAETCKQKNSLIRKADAKVIKELGLKVEKCEETRKESATADYSGPESEEKDTDYTNNRGGGSPDYNGQTDGFDYNEGGRKEPNGFRRPMGRGGPDYGGDYDHN